MARNESCVYSVGGKQLVARHQVIGGLQDSLVQGEDSKEREQSERLLKVHFPQHLRVALEVTEQTFGSNLFWADFNAPALSCQG